MEWSDIQGWFDFQELYRQQVGQAAPGAHFVEVGSWLGRSTVFMAQQIKESGKPILFDAVDTWAGGSDSIDNERIAELLASGDSASVYPVFIDNLFRCGVYDYVRPVKAESLEAVKGYQDGSLDFVFIDADHSEEAVFKDLTAWWPKVKEGGTLAGHDYGEPGPTAGLERFLGKAKVGAHVVGRSFVIPKAGKNAIRISLGIPSYGLLDSRMAIAAIASSTANRHRVEVHPKESSLLANGFNQLWVDALESGYTHFAMLHADVVPQNGWIDTLMEELERTGADIISAVSPIKDDRGITSMGIANDPAYWWTPLRRFTMREIVRFPLTFSAEDAGYPGRALLVNTGCWLADLRNPLWRAEDGRGNLLIYFTIRDRVWKNGEKILCGVQSEDWFFSERLHAVGLKAVATRKVQLQHIGRFPYPNNIAWGKWESDEDTRPLWEQGKQE